MYIKSYLTLLLLLVVSVSSNISEVSRGQHSAAHAGTLHSGSCRSEYFFRNLVWKARTFSRSTFSFSRGGRMVILKWNREAEPKWMFRGMQNRVGETEFPSYCVHNNKACLVPKNFSTYKSKAWTQGWKDFATIWNVLHNIKTCHSFQPLRFVRWVLWQIRRKLTEKSWPSNILIQQSMKLNRV